MRFEKNESFECEYEWRIPDFPGRRVVGVVLQILAYIAMGSLLMYLVGR